MLRLASFFASLATRRPQHVPQAIGACSADETLKVFAGRRYVVKWKRPAFGGFDVQATSLGAGQMKLADTRPVHDVDP